MKLVRRKKNKVQNYTNKCEMITFQFASDRDRVLFSNILMTSCKRSKRSRCCTQFSTKYDTFIQLQHPIQFEYHLSTKIQIGFAIEKCLVHQRKRVKASNANPVWLDLCREIKLYTRFARLIQSYSYSLILAELTCDLTRYPCIETHSVWLCINIAKKSHYENSRKKKKKNQCW